MDLEKIKDNIRSALLQIETANDIRNIESVLGSVEYDLKEALKELDTFKVTVETKEDKGIKLGGRVEIKEG